MTFTWSLKENLRSILVVLAISITLWMMLISVAYAEVIKSFNANYRIHEDSSMTVTETIVYDFGDYNRHGLFRNVKDKHPQKASTWYKERYVDIDLISVSRNGSPEPYKLEPYKGLSVRIGDEDTTVSGVQTYTIVYKLVGAISSYSESGEMGETNTVQAENEFYWNVTGDEWVVSMQSVAVTLTTDSGVSLDVEQYCYSGVSGSNSVCSGKKIIASSNGPVALFENDYLSPGQELTIAQAIDFPNLPVVMERVTATRFFIIIFVLFVIGLFLHGYKWRYKYKSDRTVVAQYEPYESFKPMFTGVLIDGRLDTKDISAGIVYLAQQGFISIRQLDEKVFGLFTVNDYEVELKKTLLSTETNFHKTILELIFSSTDTPGKVVKLSELKKDRRRLMLNSSRVRSLNAAIQKDLKDLGFTEVNKKSLARTLVGCVLAVIIVFLILFSILSNEPDGAVLIVCFVAFILGIVFLIFTNQRRTQKGYEALNYLKGFKKFLSVTEKERYKFHNAPALSPQQFMEYLPYAIAFGVEKEWASVFKDIIIDSPDWYSSSTGARFDAVAFSGGIGAFSTAFAGSTSSSGSSGGGSSGGGGGGGGGGSW